MKKDKTLTDITSTAIKNNTNDDFALYGAEMAITTDFSNFPDSLLKRMYDNDLNITTWFNDEACKPTKNGPEKIGAVIQLKDKTQKFSTDFYFGFIKEYQQRKYGKSIKTTDNQKWIFCALKVETQLGQKPPYLKKYGALYMDDAILEKIIIPFINKSKYFNQTNLDRILKIKELNLEENEEIILPFCNKAIEKYRKNK